MILVLLFFEFLYCITIYMLLTYLCASTNILSILISQQFGNKDKEKDDGKTTSLVGENNVN